MQSSNDSSVLEPAGPGNRPSYARLFAVLLAWSLAFAQSILGPLWQAIGLALVWWHLLRQSRSTWSETREHLNAKVSWVDLVLTAGAFALLFALPAALKAIEERLPGAPMLMWAVLWLFGVAYAVARFSAARRRWVQAIDRHVLTHPSASE